MKAAVTFSFDKNYKRFAEGLIQTFKKHVSGFDILARYVTTSLDDTLTELAGVPLLIDNVDLSTKRDKFKSFPNDFHLDLRSIGNYSRLLASDLMIYTNHSKFFNVHRLLEEGYDLIVAVNCDFLFVDNFDILVDVILKMGDDNSGKIFANYELEHKKIQSKASIGECVSITSNKEQMLKPADDDFLVIVGNTKPVRDIFRNIYTDLHAASTCDSNWNDDGVSLAKHSNEADDVELIITPLPEFQKCCLINLDHLYTTPIELFKKYPSVKNEIIFFYDKNKDTLDIQVHVNFFDKLKDINPDLYLPRHPRGHDPESGQKWDFFEEEIFIHLKKSAAFYYHITLNGSRPGVSGINIRKVSDYDYSTGDTIVNWSQFLYDVKM